MINAYQIGGFFYDAGNRTIITTLVHGAAHRVIWRGLYSTIYV